jgi:hypothetical protein
VGRAREMTEKKDEVDLLKKELALAAECATGNCFACGHYIRDYGGSRGMCQIGWDTSRAACYRHTRFGTAAMKKFFGEDDDD